MRFLLDVNALIALGLGQHQFHQRVFRWVDSERKSSTFLTCPITELGFVRILSQSSAFGMGLADAKQLLLRMKSNPALPLAFIPDTHDIASLPAWVKTPKQTTDGHLAELATAHKAVLATFDQSIPGAHLIP